MSNTILILGGTGLIGKTIHEMISERNPKICCLIGTRRNSNDKNYIQVDVDDLNTFEKLKIHSINLIVVCVKDKYNNALHYAIKHKIDYIDITKPTPELMKAYSSIDKNLVESKIVFSSGWMSGITPLILYATGVSTNEIKQIKIVIYYSSKDKAGKSSADFMAENVSKPFVVYENNFAVQTKHFLKPEDHIFNFDSQKRKIFDIDIPDLFIFNQIEKIPTVKAKVTFNSKLVTSALAFMQKINFFKILIYRERKLIFGGSGNGDISAFEIIFSNHKSEETRICVKSEGGQSELTAFSAVLHIEKMLENSNPNGIYFSHQLHQPQKFVDLLTSNKSITIQ